MKFVLDLTQFDLGSSSLFSAFLLDPLYFFQSFDELLVGLGKSFDIDDASFRFLGSLDGSDLKILGIFLEQLVGHLSNFVLCLGSFLGMRDGPPLENNPEIPPSSRDEGMELLFEPVDGVAQIIGLLGIFRITGRLSFG